MSNAILLIILLLPREAAERKPIAESELEFLRAVRAQDFDTFKKALPRFGARGGFMPRVLSDEMAAGIVYGMCRRYPGRMHELLKVKIRDSFREQFRISFLVAGGAPLLRKAASDDAELAAWLKRVPEDLSLARLDPKNRASRGFLAFALCIHSDLVAAARLAGALGSDPELTRLLAALAIVNPDLLAFCRELRPIAREPVRAELDWICSAAGAKKR